MRYGCVMDSKQVWYGCYFSLDDVGQFLGKQPESAFKHSKIHELFITWVVARFLQAQTKRERVIGFPSLKMQKGLTLSDLLVKGAALDSENFDTVITDARNLGAKNPGPAMLVQVKRYTMMQNANTDDFFTFMCRKVQRYGKAPEISVVFHILQDMKFDHRRFCELLKGQSFEVGCIIVFSATPLRQKCFLFEVFPNYTGVLWSPKAENE